MVGRSNSRQTAATASEPVTDKPLRQFMGYRLKRTYNSFSGKIKGQLATLELRIPTYSTLLLIVESPGIPQSTVASLLDIKRSNMAVMIEELEQLGLVKRKRAANDRRVFSLFPTAVGKRRCQRAVAMNLAHEEQLLTRLTADELHNLTVMLEKLECSVEEEN